MVTREDFAWSFTDRYKHITRQVFRMIKSIDVPYCNQLHDSALNDTLERIENSFWVVTNKRRLIHDENVKRRSTCETLIKLFVSTNYRRKKLYLQPRYMGSFSLNQIY